MSYVEGTTTAVLPSPSPDSNLERWTENEEYVGYGANGHFTQVIWRATKYIGCGEASRAGCNYQVCRYVTPGNCNINEDNFMEKALAGMVKSVSPVRGELVVILMVYMKHPVSTVTELTLVEGRNIETNLTLSRVSLA